MKTSLAALMSVLFLLSMAAAQTMSTDQGSVQQTLIQMEQKWAEAAKADNPGAINSMLSDNLVNLDSDGTMHSKTDTLDRMKKAKWETNEVSDMQVSQNGNTAIVTGTWRGKGVDSTGKNVDATERFVDTWQQMPDGTWKCIASASAPMK